MQHEDGSKKQRIVSGKVNADELGPDHVNVSAQELLRLRTKQFALRAIRLYRSLPSSAESQVIGKQVLRSGTSVAANYRAAGRARSKAEFVAKIGIVVEEADETVFWLELLVESGTVSGPRLESLLQETHELVAIFAASQRTARASHASGKHAR